MAEEKEPIRRQIIGKELTVDDFDKHSEEILFKKICNGHFSTLLNYP